MGRGVTPVPMSRRHHLWIEKQIPRGKRPPAMEDTCSETLDQPSADERCGPRKHWPGESDDNGYVCKARPDRGGVLIAPEWKTGVHTEQLYCEASEHGDRSDLRDPATTIRVSQARRPDQYDD